MKQLCYITSQCFHSHANINIIFFIHIVCLAFSFAVLVRHQEWSVINMPYV
jgi:hypothetical protein